jgi:hypothetical protein
MLSFLPAVLAALADGATTALVRAHQPYYPRRLIVFQIVMFGAALLSAVPSKWARAVGFVVLLAGMALAGFSVGGLYIPAFFAAVWIMTRDEQQGPKGSGS